MMPVSCVNCKHYSWGYWDSEPLCMVLGYKKLARIVREMANYCGVEAKWFECKELEKKDWREGKM
jgi:hypothetical protein